MSSFTLFSYYRKEALEKPVKLVQTYLLKDSSYTICCE